MRNKEEKTQYIDNCMYNCIYQWEVEIIGKIEDHNIISFKGLCLI